MIARDPGMAQSRRPRCFSKKTFDDITAVSDPEDLTASEIEKGSRPLIASTSG